MLIQSLRLRYNIEQIGNKYQVVFECAGNRPLYFSAFDPEICILTAAKQTRFPVFFLTEGGEAAYADPRLASLEGALSTCMEGNLDGIVTDAHPLLRDPSWVKRCQNLGFHILSYGGNKFTLKDIYILYLAALFLRMFMRSLLLVLMV